MASAKPLLRRVIVRNYKSIAACDVELGVFSILVGRNGSGKSNFLDALRFVAESLSISPSHACQFQGGAPQVLRRFPHGGDERFLEFELTVELPHGSEAEYRFALRQQLREFVVASEKLEIKNSSGNVIGFQVHDSKPMHLSANTNYAAQSNPLPPATPRRLYLQMVGELEDYQPVYKALTQTVIYDFNPTSMATLGVGDPEAVLTSDGSNLSAIWARLGSKSPQCQERILEYLRLIDPSVQAVQEIELPAGIMENVRLLQFERSIQGKLVGLQAHQMPAGTLRAFGVLVAALPHANDSSRPRLIGFEEPETGLHPAAAGALMDALSEASENNQILMTTHSPDLLDRLDPDIHTLLVAEAEDGISLIGQPDRASVRIIRESLLSAGDLLRQDQLEPVKASNGAATVTVPP